MGSIGQYAGVKDYTENAYIENVIMLNAEVRLNLPNPFSYNLILTLLRMAHALKDGQVQTSVMDTLRT